MTANAVVVTVPGKVMLAGEYCVLEGGAALASTISQTMRVSMKALPPNSGCYVRSDLWDSTIKINQTPAFEPSELQKPLFDAAMWCLDEFKLTDIEIAVDSDLSVSHGVGSSAALRYGLLLAASALKHGVPDANSRWDLARHAWSLQAKGQHGISSGYDIATQNLGGLVCMVPAEDAHDWPGIVTRMSQGPAWLNRYLHIYASGKGAPTASLVRSMQSWLDQNDRRSALKDASQVLVSHISELVATSEAPKHTLFKNIKVVRNLFAQSPADLPWKEKLETMADLDSSWSYKTTGAGGDDAIIIFASPEYNQLHIAPVLKRMGINPAPFTFSNQRAEVFLQ